MRKTWRYFRVEGDPPEYAGENLFTVVIHHGGRFYSNLGLNKEYKGGEILYLDGVDADKMSLTELNSWAYDIGYCKGPITFQYKISGCGFVQIEKDCHVVDMFAQAPESERCIDIYICCLDARKSLEELEAETNPIVDHEKFNGHIIPDIEEEHAVMTGGVTVNHVLNDDDMMHQTFWEAFQNVESREEDGECSKKKRKRSKGKENVAEVEVEEENSDVDPDYIVDSDYDLHSADDDDDDVGNVVWDTTRGDLFNDVEEPDSDKSVDSSLLESPKEMAARLPRAEHLPEDSICSICLEDYNRGTIPRRTHCGHVFHETCLAEWYRRSDSCPVCRASALESSSIDSSSTESSSTELESTGNSN